MTNEEAAKKVYEFGQYHAIQDLPHSAQTVEAFQMAINALKTVDEQNKVILELRLKLAGYEEIEKSRPQVA